MNGKITFASKKGFNQSSKIIAFKLGLNASIILSNLIYKHNYWSDEDKLIMINEETYFFITLKNLEGESSIKQSAIKKAIIDLKNVGLIKVKRKGVPATNHYCLNEEVINAFESRYENEYLERIEELKSTAKKDRQRFNQHNKINLNDKTKETKSTTIIKVSENELIEQMRNSMGCQVHCSGQI